MVKVTGGEGILWWPPTQPIIIIIIISSIQKLCVASILWAHHRGDWNSRTEQLGITLTKMTAATNAIDVSYWQYNKLHTVSNKHSTA